MINEVVLVGKIREISNKEDNKSDLLLEVERPFNEAEGRKSDIFICKLWNAIFNRIVSASKIGDLVAVKGRMICDNDQYLVVAENVVILNKTNNNILKQV